MNSTRPRTRLSAEPPCPATDNLPRCAFLITDGTVAPSAKRVTQLRFCPRPARPSAFCGTLFSRAISESRAAMRLSFIVVIAGLGMVMGSTSPYRAAGGDVRGALLLAANKGDHTLSLIDPSAGR